MSLPVFRMNTGDRPLVWPTSSGENEMAFVVIVATGTAPIPETGNEVVGMEAFDVIVSVAE